MSKWLMDLTTARHLADNYKQYLNTTFWFSTCPYCGASYFDTLEHDCDNVIELETDEATWKRMNFEVIKGDKT